MEYAESIQDGSKPACKELRQAVDRFFRDLQNPAYEMDGKAPEVCIGIIAKTLCHQQGERQDGTPLRGDPVFPAPGELMRFKVRMPCLAKCSFRRADSFSLASRTLRITGISMR